MKAFTIRFLITLGLVSSINLFGQYVPDMDKMVSTPASPEAAAFAKYGNTPVSIYSGTPNVGVPLGSVMGRSIQIPLGLSYDASGIKVEQISTWVGLGWNLSVGGAVTRMTKGLPDDYTFSQPEYSPYYSTKNADWLNFETSTNSTNYFYQYFLENQLNTAGNPLNEVEAYRDYINAREAGTVDFEPDLYSFSVMGLSGTMYIDYATGTAICIEQPDLLIEPNIQDAPGNLGSGFGVKEVLGWTITDNQGNVYEFNQVEKTEFNDNMDVGKAPRQRHFNSAWHCTKITTTNKRDIVTFEYSIPAVWDNEQFVSGNEMNIFIGTGTTQCGIPPTVSPTNNATYKIWQFDLESISINGNTRVQFDVNNPAQVREDLEGRSRLEGIRILNRDGSSNNHILFDQSYFTNGGNREWDKRLRLDSVRILGANDAALSDASMLQTYTFNYFNDHDLPSRDSYAQDYWGYFNGKSGNSTRGAGNAGTLIPEDANYDHPNFMGADRNPSFSHARTGTLKEISYPTGGSTEFFYQPHFVQAQSSGIVNATSYYKDIVHEQLLLDGFEDVSDPSGALNSGCTLTDFITKAPARSTKKFDVPEDGNYEVIYSLTDDGSIQDEMGIVYISKGTELSLCHVLQYPDDPNLIFFDQDDPDHPVDSPIYGPNNRFFEAGEDYFMVAISNVDIINLSVSRNELITPSGGGSTLENVAVGGFRVYKIQDKPDSISIAQTRYFYYDELESEELKNLNDSFFASSTASSGILQVPLDFVSPAARRSLDQSSGVKYTCDFVQRYATNQYKPKPYVVTYSQVTQTVSDGSNFNGFTVSEFFNQREATQLPYQKNHLNGKLKGQSVYNEDLEMLQKTESVWKGENIDGVEGFYLNSHLSGIYNLKWEQSLSNGIPAANDYKYIYTEMGVTGTGGSSWGGSAVSGQVSGVSYVKIGVVASWGNYIDFIWGAGASGNTSPDPCFGDPDCLKSGSQSVYEQVNYGVSTVWYTMDSQSVTTYNESGLQTAVTNYVYHDKSVGNYNVKETQVVDSEGDTFITRYTYPIDLIDSVGSGNIYDELVDLNRLGSVVRTQSIKMVDSVEVVLQEQETTFKATSTAGVILPDKMLYATNGGALIPRMQYVSYDGRKNPTWLVKDDVQSIEYLWSAEGKVPLAQISGVKKIDGSINEAKGPPIVSLSANDYAYSSFESGNTGGWTYTGNTTSGTGLPSGQKHYVLNSGSIGKTIDPTQYYSLGFWARGTQAIKITGQPDITPTSDWKYYQVTIYGLGAVGVQSSGADIDELRLFVQGTQMTTYSYDEALRMITQVGPNGIPIHYEYDALGRLARVKDHEGNIVKLMKYGFKSVVGN